MGAGNAARSALNRDRNPSLCGTWVKAGFTISAAARYGFGMVTFASLALAAAALTVPLERAEPQASAPVRQATVTVTILGSARLHFSQIEKTSPGSLRESRVRQPDGSRQTVKLVEFQ